MDYVLANAVAPAGLGLLASLTDGLLAVWAAIWPIVLICLGFSAVIFVHELGHFLVAKWCGVRIEKFAIGFFREVFGFTRGETRYSFNLLPLGGYVKMLGQEDFDDKSLELKVQDDPRAFSNKPVGQRMLIVSAGVVMNVLFAGLLFMIVFMIGKQGGATEVGYVRPNWPAALAGLQPGDLLERVNGEDIDEFMDLNYAIMLADPLVPLDFQVRRQGETKHFQVTPLNNEDEGLLLQVGLAPAVTRTIGAVGPSCDPARADQFHVNDVVVELNGQPVTDENANAMMWRLSQTPSEITDAVVERAESDAPGAPIQRVHVKPNVQLGLYPSDYNDRTGLRAHVLGLAPMTRVVSVDPEGRAYLAGLAAGDVILKWGDRRYPSYLQIMESVKQNGEVDIPVVVERRGAEVSLSIRPKVKRGLTGSTSKPSIGASLTAYATDLLRVAAVIDTIDERPSPAARSGLPEGALITKVNDVPVQTWIDLIEQFRAGVGTTVTLTYDYDGKSGLTCSFEVPHELRTVLDLPSYAWIGAIDGEESVRVVDKEGRRRTLSVSSPPGLREILKQKVGHTVKVSYAASPFSAMQTAEVLVTPDMVDPWLGRIIYSPDVQPIQATKMLRKGPLGAVRLGVKKTIYFIVSVYTTMQRMIFSRSLGVENLSGPVGIIRLGRNVAQVGIVELLFFLAMISANLAVLNFLPLPIVDGGLMVFLLIEKLKGSPVNLKIQMATQVIGLILIGAAFVFVTIQDFTK
jgi:regulator of sigma E protease